MTKKKYYVVWKGHQVGVFDNWEDCKKQVEGFPAPEYKSFPNWEMAKYAFEKGSKEFLIKKPHPIKMIMDGVYGQPVVPSISVDGAFSSTTRLAEYQGVDTETQTVIFKAGKQKNLCLEKELFLMQQMIRDLCKANTVINI